MIKSIKEIESYLNTLKEDQKQRVIKIENFKRFIQADDPEGLVTLGKTLLLLKQEFQMVREFIYNIENALKLKEITN